MTPTDEKKKIAEEAHVWQALITDGPLSKEEEARFHAWLDASSENREAFERAKLLWADMSSLRSNEIGPALSRPLIIETMLAQRERFATVPASFGGLVMRFGGAAAVLLVTVFFVLPSFETTRPSGTVIHRTGIAETKELCLEDGSLVALGAVSVLSVRIDAESRDIELKQGEALFDVSPDSNRPFTVLSGGFSARAVGTSFQVSRRSGEILVAVAEGVVDVERAVPPEKSEVMSSNSPRVVRLTVGEQVSATERSGLAAVSNVDVETLGAWRVGRLMYVNAPLSNLVSDANRYGARRIYIADDKVADLVINAVFPSDDIDGMLTTLSEALPITLRNYPDGVYIHAKAAETEN